MADAFRLAQKSMGVILEKGKQSPLRPKRFRKIFKTACSNSKLDIYIIKTFLGHAGDSSQTYQEESRETLEFYYEMVEPKITLFQDESFEREEVIDLKSKILKMQNEIQELDATKQELEKHKRESKENISELIKESKSKEKEFEKRGSEY